MIRIQDLVDEDARLHIMCRLCGRGFFLSAGQLAKQHGARSRVSDVVARMRCSRDRMVPEAVVIYPNTAGDEAMRRRGGIFVHPQWALWQPGKNAEWGRKRESGEVPPP